MSGAEADPARTVSFQGRPGAYSHLACREVLPDWTALPCQTFEDAFAAVHEGRAARAMIPVENSVNGRVADIHHLLPEGGLHIEAEHFQPVRHCLLGLPGARLEDITAVHSHEQALGQCRATLRALGLTPVRSTDTAGAAEEVAREGNPAHAAIASSLAAETYGLQVLQADLHDDPDNTTRFLILAPEASDPGADHAVITSFVFRVRNIPAALYKALGGFATNGVNMTKLESYMVGGHFRATQFYADIEGHPSDPMVRLALEELSFFAREVHVLGVYPAHPFRLGAAQSSEAAEVTSS